MDLKKKEEIIEYLNLNYRTILSYGNKGLVPMGEFIVTDIIADDIPEEYSDMISERSTARVVLKNSENEEQQIVIPLNKFMTECLEKATQNAGMLDISIETTISYEQILKHLDIVLAKDESAFMEDGRFEHLSLVDLEDCDVELVDNKGNQNSSNLFICPFDLGMWKEKIRERYAEAERKRYAEAERER